MLECKSATKSAEMLALNDQIRVQSASSKKETLLHCSRAKKECKAAPLEHSGAGQRDGPMLALQTSRAAH
jgi:hypothetical protein